MSKLWWKYAGIRALKTLCQTAIATIGTSALPLKARLPKYSEVTDVGCTTTRGSCPAWIVEYLADSATGTEETIYPDNETIAGIRGYWLLSSSSTNGAYPVFDYVNLTSNADVNDETRYGIRPVITVSKSDLN